MKCENCGEEFEPWHGNQKKYCSKACCSAASRKRWRARNPERVCEHSRRYYRANCEVVKLIKKARKWGRRLSTAEARRLL